MTFPKNTLVNPELAASDMDECIITFEEVVANLKKVELQLAARFNMNETDHNIIRQKLIELDRSNLIIEDEVVANWHSWYSWLVNWDK